MTSQPRESPEEPKVLQALDRDPLTTYLGPYCERVTDSGEPLESLIKMDTAQPLVSVIVSARSEAGSETVITTIKEEPLEPETGFEGELEKCEDMVDEEPFISESSTMETNKSHWNFHRILSELATTEQCIKFAEDRGLIPTTKQCNHHRRPMRLIKRGYLGTFCCSKVLCRVKPISRCSGTWFEQVRLPIYIVFQIMYMVSHKYSYLYIQKYTARDNGIMLSVGTITNWYATCRDTIAVYHLEHPDAEHKIGGPGKVVYMELSKIGERTLKICQRIEGQWVIGIIEKGNDDLRLEICPDSKESLEMLIPLIVQKHIEVGTEIRTDPWIAHHCNSQKGFKHKTVTDNATVETEIPLEPMDSNWRRIKALFKRSRFRGSFTDWLIEYSWRRNIRISNKCAFEELLKAVQYSY